MIRARAKVTLCRCPLLNVARGDGRTWQLQEFHQGIDALAGQLRRDSVQVAKEQEHFPHGQPGIEPVFRRD